MKSKAEKSEPAQFITTLNMNHLQGRMLLLPSAAQTRKREILIVYGQLGTIERWWRVIEELHRYGSVTVTDLPGFGGMDSLYRINKRPGVNELADYLAAFVKLRYKRKRLTIIGIGFGFVVATRMLQRYPDLVKKVDLLVSVGGFTRYDELSLAPKQRRLRKIGSRVGLIWPLYGLIRFGYRSYLLFEHLYIHTQKPDEAGVLRTLDMRRYLWKVNDIRTWLYTNLEILHLDNCQKQVAMPVWHVSASSSTAQNMHILEQHYHVIFTDYQHLESKQDIAKLSYVVTSDEAKAILPTKLRRLLSKT